MYSLQAVDDSCRNEDTSQVEQARQADRCDDTTQKHLPSIHQMKHNPRQSGSSHRPDRFHASVRWSVLLASRCSPFCLMTFQSSSSVTACELFLYLDNILKYSTLCL